VVRYAPATPTAQNMVPNVRHAPQQVPSYTYAEPQPNYQTAPLVYHQAAPTYAAPTYTVGGQVSSYLPPSNVVYGDGQPVQYLQEPVEYMINPGGYGGYMMEPQTTYVDPGMTYMSDGHHYYVQEPQYVVQEPTQYMMQEPVQYYVQEPVQYMQEPVQYIQEPVQYVQEPVQSVHPGYVQPGYSQPVEYSNVGQAPRGFAPPDQNQYHQENQQPVYADQGMIQHQMEMAPQEIVNEADAIQQEQAYQQQVGAEQEALQQVIAAEGQQNPSEAVVKGQVGDWLICEDSAGEFYSHAQTQESFDQPPEELLRLLEQQRQ